MFTAAFVVALVATPFAARVAARIGFVDRPGPLKVHQAPVPYLGGVAVFMACAVPIAFVHPALLIPLSLALTLGLLDDARSLPASTRFAAEIAIGLVAGVVAPAPGSFGVLVT